MLGLTALRTAEIVEGPPPALRDNLHRGFPRPRGSGELVLFPEAPEEIARAELLRASAPVGLAHHQPAQPLFHLAGHDPVATEVPSVSRAQAQAARTRKKPKLIARKTRTFCLPISQPGLSQTNEAALPGLVRWTTHQVAGTTAHRKVGSAAFTLPCAIAQVAKTTERNRNEWMWK